MTDKKKSLFPGILLILLGISLFIRRMDPFYFNWDRIFPLVLLALGVTLFAEVFRNRRTGPLFWGVVLLVIGAFSLLRNYELVDFLYMADLGPVFLIALGLGFFALFVNNPRDWGVLFPSALFLFIGFTLGLRNLNFYFWDWDGLVEKYWPVVLIFIGVGLLTSGIVNQIQNKKDSEGEDEP